MSAINNVVEPVIVAPVGLVSIFKQPININIDVVAFSKLCIEEQKEEMLRWMTLTIIAQGTDEIVASLKQEWECDECDEKFCVKRDKKFFVYVDSHHTDEMCEGCRNSALDEEINCWMCEESNIGIGCDNGQWNYRRQEECEVLMCPECSSKFPEEEEVDEDDEDDEDDEEPVVVASVVEKCEK